MGFRWPLLLTVSVLILLILTITSSAIIPKFASTWVSAGSLHPCSLCGGVSGTLQLSLSSHRYVFATRLVFCELQDSAN